jgi:hypothetical protein
VVLEGFGSDLQSGTKPRNFMGGASPKKKKIRFFRIFLLKKIIFVDF